MFFRYDPKTDQWTLIAPISSPRDAVGVCLLGDRLYAVGGYDGQQYIKDVESYDPISNEWTKVFTQVFRVSYKGDSYDILCLFLAHLWLDLCKERYWYCFYSGGGDINLVKHFS